MGEPPHTFKCQPGKKKDSNGCQFKSSVPGQKAGSLISRKLFLVGNLVGTYASEMGLMRPKRPKNGGIRHVYQAFTPVTAFTKSQLKIVLIGEDYGLKVSIKKNKSRAIFDPAVTL